MTAYGCFRVNIIKASHGFELGFKTCTVNICGLKLSLSLIIVCMSQSSARVGCQPLWAVVCVRKRERERERRRERRWREGEVKREEVNCVFALLGIVLLIKHWEPERCSCVLFLNWVYLTVSYAVQWYSDPSESPCAHGILLSVLRTSPGLISRYVFPEVLEERRWLIHQFGGPVSVSVQLDRKQPVQAWPIQYYPGSCTQGQDL